MPSTTAQIAAAFCALESERPDPICHDPWARALAGDAFDEGGFDAKYGPGFGVHYLSPVGAVRLELANGVSENGGDWRLVVNIGAEF